MLAALAACGGGGSDTPATFAPDGSAQALWTVANGELLIAFQGLVQRYTLVSNDSVARYFKVTKHSDNGTVSTVGMFYDQTTGLTQAQNFVATKQVS